MGGDDLWLDAYVGDFLTRARERGFAVPQVAFNLALDRLRNFVANTTQVEDNAANLAYAAYVLARNGRPVMGDLRYLADTKMEAFTTPLSRGQIAAALALLGDRARSQAAFIGGRRSDPERARHRRVSGRLRLAPARRRRASDAGVRGRQRAVDRSAAWPGSSKRNAAPGARARRRKRGWFSPPRRSPARADGIELRTDGTDHRGAFYRTYKDAALERDGIVLANAGATPVQAVVTVSGNPIEPEPAIAHGYAVERSYYRLDGSQVQPSSVRQNDRLVVVLKVTEAEAREARLLLVDRLPAGFEIDNPNLVDSDTVASLSWLKRDVEPAHTEYRDDRFVAAFDRKPDQPAFFTVAYMVRAVSPGTYVHPAVQIEDMYRPERYGRTAFGSVEVGQAR